MKLVPDPEELPLAFAPTGIVFEILQDAPAITVVWHRQVVGVVSAHQDEISRRYANQLPDHPDQHSDQHHEEWERDDKLRAIREFASGGFAVGDWLSFPP